MKANLLLVLQTYYLIQVLMKKIIHLSRFGSSLHMCGKLFFIDRITIHFKSQFTCHPIPNLTGTYAFVSNF